MTAQPLSRRFEAALAANEHFLTYQGRLKKPPYSRVNAKEILTEARRLQAERQTRSLTFTELTGQFIPRITKASLQVGAHRSRLVELKAQVQRVESLLSDYLEILTNTLRVDLRGPLERDFSTEKLREAALKSALRTGWSTLASYKVCKSILDDFIKDCDQGYWSLKLITDVYAQGRVEGFRQ